MPSEFCCLSGGRIARPAVAVAAPITLGRAADRVSEAGS